jgi:hypothetical protein
LVYACRHLRRLQDTANKAKLRREAFRGFAMSE